tara:strand:- start:438 stop:821 length:384 start_codon:yes stop_codon:yes gene_type:complete
VTTPLSCTPAWTGERIFSRFESSSLKILGLFFSAASDGHTRFRDPDVTNTPGGGAAASITFSGAPSEGHIRFRDPDVTSTPGGGAITSIAFVNLASFISCIALLAGGSKLLLGGASVGDDAIPEPRP